MNYIEVSINLTNLPNYMNEILPAELGEIGFESFMEVKGKLLAYISVNNFDIDILKHLQSEYNNFQFEVQEIKQQNWNAQWESNFNPVEVKHFCYIRASFHEPKDGFEHEIIIEPKMSFGTGHHATTRLMLQLMQSLDITGKDVLDMGCGTGILAIIAKKLSAKTVVGIDIDAWAVTNSIENAKRNNICNISFKEGMAKDIRGKYDIILANINRNILINDMVLYIKHLKDNGIILFSGFYQNDIHIIENEANKHNMQKQIQVTEDQWSALSFKKT